MLIFEANAAERFTEGFYTYTVENGEATIIDCDENITGDIVVPETLGGYPVTEIGEKAFYLCCHLTNVEIPDSVTNIGLGAFYKCTSLTSVTIPYSVTSLGDYTFDSCTSLTSITVDSANPSYSSDKYGVLFNKDKTELIQYLIGNTRTSYVIPDSVTSIGNFAFDSCTALTSVTIPNSVTNIGAGAFSGCTSLTSVTIPDSVTGIASYVFDSCTSLTSVTIPDSVTYISCQAFKGCTSLTSITIPDSVTSIGDDVFGSCTALTSIAIPRSVTSIGDYAFKGCTSLTSITIPDSVTSIGDCLFIDCTSLTSITVDSANTSYSSDEYGVLFNKDKTELIQYPIGNTRTSYVIPDSVTSIGNSAFDSCANLTSITIPDSVTNIGSGAFCACTSLTSVTIPDSVTSIGNYAFISCISFTSVTIPDSVTNIGNSAFYNCSALASITIPDSVTSIGDEAFYWCDALKNVYYEGVEEEWNKISIGERNESLLNAKIHFKNVLSSENDNVCIEYMDGVVEGSVMVNATELSDEEFKNFEHNFELNEGLNVKYAYDITLKDVDSNKTIPNDLINGKVTVKIKLLDETINIKKLRIVHYSKENKNTNYYTYGEKLEDKKFVVNNGYIIFDVDHFSYFFICVESDEPVIETTYPTVTIRNNPETSTVNYKEVVRYYADATNLPEGAEIWWYVNGEKVANTESIFVGYEVDYVIAVKILDAEGNVLTDESGNEISDSLNVTVNDSVWIRIAYYFDWVINFIKMIFKF